MKLRYFLAVLTIFFLNFSLASAQKANIPKLKSAYNKAKKSRNKSSIATAAFSLGNAYRLAKSNNSAFRYLEEAEMAARDSKKEYYLAKALTGQGQIFNDRKEWGKAIKVFFEASKIFKKKNDKHGFSEALFGGAVAYLNAGDNEERITGLFKDALKNANESNMPWIASASAKYLYRYYEGKVTKAKNREEYKKYYSYSRLYKNIYGTFVSGYSSEKELERAEATIRRKDSKLEAQKIEIINQQHEIIKQDLQIQHQQDSIKMQEQELSTNALILERNELRQRNYTFIAIGVVLIFLFLILYFIKTQRAKKKIEAEKEKSDELLLNILPKETAEELKKNGKSRPRSYEAVSVLFTDFKGFTFLAEKLTPEELVEELDYCFAAFDEICKRHRMEKIKTIGDAYMCAGGIPAVNDTNPWDAVEAALEMQQFMADWQAEKATSGEPGLSLRLGIHSGKAVAGVVGKHKFAYDIWGDTVNTASRMESSGEPDRINISGETYRFIKDDYRCSYRGKIQAKNKGEIDMYFVDGKL